MYKHTVAAADVGARLDLFTQAMTRLSRSAAQKLIEGGHVTVGGVRAKANHRLRFNDAIEITVPEAAAAAILPENIPLAVVYEDSDVIVIDKPKGMVVHPAPGHFSGTLVNALMFHCADSLSGINGELRPGIVHRIDKDTSGLIVAAKNDRAHNHLAAQFAAHSIQREYVAIVHGGFADDSGTVDVPIARHHTDRKKMAITKDGRRAVTHYTVLERLGRFTLIRCTLETGRTHQIRVHMASIGHPVLGDEVYSAAKHPFNTEGQALHAQVLGFERPNGERMRFESPPPPYFQRVLVRLKS